MRMQLRIPSGNVRIVIGVSGLFAISLSSCGCCGNFYRLFGGRCQKRLFGQLCGLCLVILCVEGWLF